MAAKSPPAATLAELMRWSSIEFGGRECLRFQGHSLTFAEVERHSAKLANILCDRGVTVGDRVAILLPNSLDWPMAWIGVLRAGAVAVPINVRYRSADLQHVLTDSSARAVFTDAEHAPQVRETSDAACIVLDAMADELQQTSSTAPDVAITPGDLANLQYTSGTTGMPKACMLTHDYWIKNSHVLAGVGNVTGQDVVLTAQPFSYIDPQWNFTMCLLLGSALVVLPRFSASGFWPAVRENQATWCYVLGTMPTLLLRQPPNELDRTHRLRMVLCSGINPSLHRDLERRWGVPWREAYGLTEEGGCLAVPLDADDTVGTGVIGRPIGAKQVLIAGPDGREVADGEIGELVVGGEPLMLGYWHRPAETAHVLREGRLHTGDLGWRDADGWFHLIGRTKDMVRRGGENISCTEVENVINEHPLVTASAVIAIPDDLWGEEAMAYLELSSTPSPRSATEQAETILTHLRARLAPFKVPRFLEFVDALPRTVSERVAKGELRTRADRQTSVRYDAIERTWIRPALRGDT